MHERDGIRSWASERPGRPLSAFRAQMELAGDAWSALAILEDVSRACEWTSHCAELTTVQTLSERELIVYARMDAPWPVRDRDVVTHIRVLSEGEGALLVTIEAASDHYRAARAGVVRMPRFRAHYRLRALPARRTSLEYQIEVDPGGTLPDWLKSMIARDLAHDTLADLRTRMRWAEAQGLYRERAQELAAQARALGRAESVREAASSTRASTARASSK